MLVQLFIMMRKPETAVASRELTDARVFYPGIEQLPIRVLHHSTV